MNQITQRKKLNHFVPDYRKVMQHLEEKRFALLDWVVQEHTLTVNIPKRFSISEQPDETIHLLRLLYTIGKCDQVKRIIFDHSKCEFLGLSASTIMDVILLVMIDYRNERNKKLSLFGKVLKNQTAKDIPPNVRQLKENFPGTVISIRMYLDKRYIEKNKENDYD